MTTLPKILKFALQHTFIPHSLVPPACISHNLCPHIPYQHVTYLTNKPSHHKVCVNPLGSVSLYYLSASLPLCLTSVYMICKSFYQLCGSD